MGLSEIKRRILVKNAKEKKKMEIMFKELEELTNEIKKIKREVENFQKRWGKYLTKNPEIADLLMRELLGLSVLERDTTMKLELDILELAKKKNITLISEADLITELQEKNKGLPITLKDVEKALNNLKKKNLIVGIITIKGIKYVQLKDFEEDIKVILEKFKDKDTLTISDIVKELKWDIPRIERALERMVSMGLAVREDYPPRYYLVKF